MSWTERSQDDVAVIVRREDRNRSIQPIRRLSRVGARVQAFSIKDAFVNNRFKRIQLIPAPPNYPECWVKIWGDVQNLKARHVAGNCTLPALKMPKEGCLSMQRNKLRVGDIYGIRYGDPIEIYNLTFLREIPDTTQIGGCRFLFKDGRCFVSISGDTPVNIFARRSSLK